MRRLASHSDGLAFRIPSLADHKIASLLPLAVHQLPRGGGRVGWLASDTPASGRCNEQSGCLVALPLGSGSGFRFL